MPNTTKACIRGGFIEFSQRAYKKKEKKKGENEKNLLTKGEKEDIIPLPSKLDGNRKRNEKGERVKRNELFFLREKIF